MDKCERCNQGIPHSDCCYSCEDLRKKLRNALLENERIKMALKAMVYVYSGENADCIDKMQDAWELVRATGLSVEKQPCEHQWVDARNNLVSSGELCRKRHA